MTVTVAAVEGGRVASVVDDLDAAVADSVGSEIEALTEPVSGLVIDLTDVSFLDSAGLRMLDRLAVRQHRAGAAIRVVAPVGGPCRFSLKLSGFPTELIDDSLADALLALPRSS